jgi:hypothetical protein
MKLVCISTVMLSIALVVFLSGCVSDATNPFNQAYCSSVGNCQVEEKAAEVYDIITIEKIEARPLPEGRVRPGSTVDVYVTLKNNDKNPVNQVDILSIAVSDPHLFTCVEPDSCEIKDKKLVSGGEKGYVFTLKAPEKWGSMTETATIEVSVKYKYQSTRLTTVSYLEKETYIDYINSGKKATVSIVNMPSNGPVDAYIDISRIGQPIVYDDATKDEVYPVLMSVTNKGQGEISSVSPGNFKLEFESDMGTFTSCDEAFGGDTCSGSGSKGTSGGSASASASSVSNTEEIRIRGSTPFNYYFDFKAPGSLTFLNDGMATTKLKTSVDYEYIIRKTYGMKVSVNAEI